jgi:hypothetical protein
MDNPPAAAIQSLIRAAEDAASRLLDEALMHRLKEKCDYITLGIDTRKTRISTTKTYIDEDHAELVTMVELKSMRMWTTGKSYPTVNQQKHLIRFPDLSSHFVDCDLGTVMLLGCHDLTLYSPRAYANAKSWRFNLIEKFRELAKIRKPTIVLQHPHTTSTPRTWSQQWSQLEQLLPSVKYFASAGRYVADNRDKLAACLMGTKRGGTIDFIVHL